MKTGIWIEYTGQFWIIRKAYQYLTEDPEYGIVWTRFREDALLFTTEGYAERYRTEHKIR